MLVSVAFSGDQSRPRALAISHREKPKLHLKRDQASALQVANSNLSDDPTGPSSGFDSLTESDERLSINPERVKIKVVINLVFCLELTSYQNY